MLPKMLDNTAPESERRRYKIVRLDTHDEVPGLIMSANIVTGLCSLRPNDNSAPKEYNFGPNGFAIVHK